MKVKYKSYKELKKLLREGLVRHISSSDDGSMDYWGTIGNPTHLVSIDHDIEFTIVDAPNPINEDDYELRKIFFEDVEEK